MAAKCAAAYASNACPATIPYRRGGLRLRILVPENTALRLTRNGLRFMSLLLYLVGAVVVVATSMLVNGLSVASTKPLSTIKTASSLLPSMKNP